MSSLLNRLRSGPVPIEKIDKLGTLLEGLALQFTPKTRAAFLAAVEAQRDRMDKPRVVEAIGKRDLSAALAAMNLSDESFHEISEPLRQAFIAAGRAATQAGAGSRLEVRFDQFKGRAVPTMQAIEDRLKRSLTEDMQGAVMKLVNDGLRDGVNPRTMATSISRVVGLSDRQVTAIENYRKGLEGLKADTLKRALRDKRYDRALKAAMSKKEPLTQTQINKMVTAYTERQLRHRGETISRTEALRAVNRGHHEAMLQGLDDGKVAGSLMRRFWIVSPGERTCDTCRPIPKLNPNGVSMNEPFMTKLGPVFMAPLHPDCRCTVAFRLAVI